MIINKEEMECIKKMYNFCCGEGCEPNCSYDLIEKIEIFLSTEH